MSEIKRRQGNATGRAAHNTGSPEVLQGSNEVQNDRKLWVLDILMLARTPLHTAPWRFWRWRGAGCPSVTSVGMRTEGHIADGVGPSFLKTEWVRRDMRNTHRDEMREKGGSW